MAVNPNPDSSGKVPGHYSSDVAIRSYKFRVYPNKLQNVAICNHLWLSKELWNEMLEYAKNKYETEQKFPSKKELREIVKHRGLYATVAQMLAERMNSALWRIVKAKKQGIHIGFPRFKNFDRMKSLYYPRDGFKINKTSIKVSPFGFFKVKIHRPIQGEIKTLMVKREASGKIYFIITTKIIQSFIHNKKGQIGIDLGLSKLAVCSDGQIISNPRFIKQYEKKIAFLGHGLSRKKKGSKNYYKAKIKLAKSYEKLGNSRLDFLHKTSLKLVNTYGLISLENLNIVNMVQKKFGKQINDAGWGTMAHMLCYKAESAGCKVVFVDPAGTTKECSKCGTIVPKQLWEREHRCPKCGLVLDRDLNAAINILNRTVGHTGIKLVESSQVEQTLKQEAQAFLEA
jgi:putative transposase